MPLSQGEIYGQEEKFIDLVFSDKPLKAPKQILDKEELYRRITTGGYPSVQELNGEDRDAWMRNYLNLILQRDIRDLAQIEKITELPNILNILATRVSNLLNVAEIARESKMVAQTLHRYLSLLETIFIINLQPSWHANLTLRFIKSPKLYLVDSGLLSYLLGVSVERILNDNFQVGKIVENFVVDELQKQVTWSRIQIGLYHFRTTGGEEVDIVLENRLGQIVGIEVKNSTKVTPDDFKGLKYLQEKVKDKFIKGIVLYTGSQYIPFGEGLYVLPINSLWNTDQLSF